LPPEFLIDDDQERPESEDIDSELFNKYRNLPSSKKDVVRSVVFSLIDGLTKPVPAAAENSENSYVTTSVGEDEGVGVTLADFVSLKRRQLKLTPAELAKKIKISQDELNCIEVDVAYEPKPRTLHKLAEFCEVPAKSLILISNFKSQKNTGERGGHTKYAAQADKMSELNPGEREILSQYVSYLNSIADRNHEK
jgi:hypothetical protein